MALLWFFLKGICIGACYQLPGLSAATLAIATGSYTFIISDVGRFARFLPPVRHMAGADTTIQYMGSSNASGVFRLLLWVSLIVGIVMGARFLSPEMRALSEYIPVLVNAVAFGVTVGALWVILRHLRSPAIAEMFAVVAGVFCSQSTAMLTPQLYDGQIMLWLGGVALSCTLFLPGISVNLLQSMLGADHLLHEAVGALDSVALIVYALGIVVGLLYMAKIFYWLLYRQGSRLIALLAGMLLGSLPLLWPWNKVDGYLLDAQGNSIPMQISHLGPANYEALFGGSAHVVSVLVLMVIGCLVAFAIGHRGFKEKV